MKRERTENPLQKPTGTILYHGILSFCIAAIILTRLYFELTQISLGSKQFAITYIVFIACVLFLSAMLVFAITAISALIIIMINNVFSMQQLYCANYNYYGNCLLLNSGLIYISFYLENTWTIYLCRFNYCMLLLAFTWKYYCNLTKDARVDKKAAVVLIAIMGTIGTTLPIFLW